MMEYTSKHHKGFTLVEMMVALILGLVVLGGAASVFISNKESYRINEALSEVQDSSRVAFELISRDLRTATLTGCTNNGRSTSALKTGSGAWWLTANLFQGFDGATVDPAVSFGTGAGDRVNGTDSFSVITTEGTTYTVAADSGGVEGYDSTNDTFVLNEDADIAAGDVLMVCDPDHAVAFQASAFNTGTETISIDDGSGSVSPGNCSQGLGFPINCSGSNEYEWEANAQIAKVRVADWYLGNNSEGGQSLFRIELVNTAGAVAAQAFEIVRNVSDFQIQYHVSGANNFVDATAVTDWSDVEAARITITTISEDDVGVDNAPISRSFVSTTTIRNRVD